MKFILLPIFFFVMFTGCSATWSGVQQDTSNAVTWTKEQVNQGATFVKEKTE